MTPGSHCRPIRHLRYWGSAAIILGLPFIGGCNVGRLVDSLRGKPSPTPAPVVAPTPAPVEAVTRNEEFQSLEAMAAEYDKLQGQVEEQNQRMATLLRQYQRRGGQLPPNFGSELTEEQRLALAQRVQQERGSLRSLLQEILDKDREIQNLRQVSEESRAALPDFVEVKEGDRHDRLILNFLRQEGASEMASRRLVSEINLQEPLLPGSRVWFYYEEGQFGTWVTQGRAALSPREAEERVRAALVAERDAAVADNGKLRKEVSTLEQRKQALERDVTLLQQEADAILVRMVELKKAVTTARTSARYVAGAKDALKDADVIGKSFLGPWRVKRLEGMEAMEVSADSTISLDASVYGLKRIKKVFLLPDGLKRGVDYEVSIFEGGAFATVTLLSTDRFQGSTFVVVME